MHALFQEVQRRCMELQGRLCGPPGWVEDLKP